MVVYPYVDFWTSGSGNYLVVKDKDNALRTSVHIAVSDTLLVRTQLTSACKTEHILHL